MINGKVYAVVAGVAYEGYSIKGIFSSLDVAARAAEKLAVEDDLGRIDASVPEWGNGCEYVAVEEYVIDAAL